MNPLEDLLVRATKDPALRPEFYRLLLDSNLLCITTPDPANDEQGNYSPGGQPPRLALWDHSGERHVPIFTSLNILDEFAAAVFDPPPDATNTNGYAHVKIQGHVLFHILVSIGTTAVLNPLWSHSKMLTKEEIRALASGELFGPGAAIDLPQSQITITPYTSASHVLIKPIVGVLETARQVEAAYLARVDYGEEDTRPRLLLALRGKGDLQGVIREVATLVRSYTELAEAIDITILDESPTWHAFDREITAFYKRTG